jgi:ATP-dependent Lhr-like helicase
MPWQVVDITESEVLASPTSGLDIMVPSWTGEDIPVSFEVAQEVGKMRMIKEGAEPLPDNQTIIVEIVEDLVVVHSCFGTKVNEAIGRVFSKQLSALIGENVIVVSDPYRIMVKLPFPLKEENIKKAFDGIRNIRSQLTDALEHSSLLKFKFLHVARMFGLLSVEGTMSTRYIQMFRNSVVYEETIRSIFFRYFDVEKTEQMLRAVRGGKINVIYDIRKKPSYFAQIGLERVSGSESVGAFEPRERIVAAFKENALSKTLRLVCLNCKTTRFIHLAGASESPKELRCHKCNQPTLAVVGKNGEPKHDIEFSAGLISAYGKRALIALSTYGIGPQTADRVLRRLHKTEEAFYLDLIEAQKNFIKNKKYWKL